MSINKGILEKALRHLPKPEREDEVHRFELPGRLELSRQTQPFSDQGEVSAVDVQMARRVVCVATRYCKDDLCWLEWELDL